LLVSVRPKKKKGAAFSQSGADTQAANSVSGADCTDTKAAISVSGADCTDTKAAISVAGADCTDTTTAIGHFSRWCGRGIRRLRNQGEIGGYQDELPGKTGGSSEPPRLFLEALLPGARKSPTRLFPHTEQHPQPAAMHAGEDPSRTKRRPKRRRETRTTTGDRRKREAPQRATSCLSAAVRTAHTSAARRRRALQTDSQTGGDSMRESERWCVQHERAETTNALT